jgi:RecA/RadA recombinase
MEQELITENFENEYIQVIKNGDLKFFRISDEQELSKEVVKRKFYEHIQIDDDEAGELFKAWAKKQPLYDSVRRSINRGDSEVLDGKNIKYIQVNEDDYPLQLYKNENLPQLLDEIINRQKSVISTTYQGLDEMMDGGFQRGYIYGIEVLTGNGKSTFAINMVSRHLSGWRKKDDGIQPPENPINIVYFDSENGFRATSQKIFQQVVACSKDPKDLKNSVLTLQKNNMLGDHFATKEFSAKNFTASEMKEIIETRLHFTPDLIVIDLMDDIKPEDANSDLQDWLRLQLNTEELSNLARDLDCAILFTTQANKNDSNKSGTIDKNKGFSSSGGGIGKIKKMAGYLFAHNDFEDADEEFKTHHRIVEARKGRDFADGWKDKQVFFEYDPTTTRLYEISEIEVMKNKKTDPEIEYKEDDSPELMEKRKKYMQSIENSMEV